jgi:hypothetical protein
MACHPKLGATISARIDSRMLAVLVAAVALVAPACGSSSSSSSGTTDFTELCGNISKMSTSISRVQKLDPATATGGEVTAAIGAVQSAWGQVQGSMATAPDELQADLGRAYGGLRRGVEGADPSASPNQVLRGLQPALTHMSSTLTSVSSDLNCA